MLVRKNVSLASFTSLEVGGPAKYFVRLKSERDLTEAVEFAHTKKIPLQVLGSGSNLLISDSGFKGLIIKNEIKGFKISGGARGITLLLGAGEEWNDIVEQTTRRGWSGVENLAGIPGSVGAAVVQNIGAYGKSLSDVLISARAFDLNKKKVITICAKDCALSYRTSLFKKTPGRYLILSLKIRLKKTAKKLSNTYRDSRYGINQELRKRGLRPTAENIRKVVIDIRNKKGMLLLPRKKKFKSAGSFFVSPIVSKTKFLTIKKKALLLDHQQTKQLMPWHWATDSNKIKIAPAFLLEFTPYHKGYRAGKVGISPLHSLALINTSGAKARDVVILAQKMQQAVFKMFGVWLVPEVRLIGFHKDPFAKR